MAHGADVEQRSLRRRVDQEIEIAAFGIGAFDDGTEDAGVAGTVRLHDATDRGAVRTQGFRWLQCQHLSYPMNGSVTARVVRSTLRKFRPAIHATTLLRNRGRNARARGSKASRTPSANRLAAS